MPRSLRLLLVFRCLTLRRATTCTTTMIAADFCRITSTIAGRCAVSVTERCCPIRSPLMRGSPHRRWLIGSGSTGLTFVQLPSPLARQISPGKNAMFPRTSAAFTLSAVSDGLRHVVLARPQTRPFMQFLSVASRVCSPASSRPALADSPLPSASGYHWLFMNPCRHSHRGLPPHYIAPMLGAHPSVNRTQRNKAAQHRLLLR